MELVTLILAALACLAALGAWLAARRAAPPAIDLDPLHRRLEEMERRLGERLETVRAAGDTHAAALRESIARGLAESREAIGQRLAELPVTVLGPVTNRLEAARNAQAEELRAARGSQDERLDRVDAALQTFAQQLQQGLTDQRDRLAAIGADLTHRQAAAAKEQADSLALRLGRVESGLQGFADKLTQGLTEQRDALAALGREISARHTQAAATTQEQLAAQLRELREASTQSLATLREEVTRSLGEVQQKVDRQMGEARRENEAKLEQIRATVEEKLQTTLEKRLGESFRTVSQQLENVQKGLGEMQVLASGVGDLKKVLSNVSTRGALGELQLARILEEVMSPGQYEENVATVPNSAERVDFAIRLPGREASGDAPVWLPIDAKFPIEDYQRLQTAYEQGDTVEINRQRHQLSLRLRAEADKIHTKYVCPPHTTDFALLFLPVEGLYAEAMRLPGLFEDLQRKHKITLAGPVTLVALLNSLQLGFRTLAIEQRSSQVWEVLSAVKTEFDKFGQAVSLVSKKLHEAQDKIGQVEVRQRAMNRKLRNVEALDAGQVAGVLYDGQTPADDDPADPEPAP